MDLKAISTNLAAQFAPGTLTPPAGLGNGMEAIRAVFGQAPQGATTTPFLVVLPRHGMIIIPGSAPFETHHYLDVNFYLSKAPGDISRVETARQAWLGVLLHAVDSNGALDLEPVVKSAFPIGYEFVELPYGDDGYDGIVIHYEVWTFEFPTFLP